MTPDLAFVVAISGALGIYFEIARPGKVLPGVGGCVLLAWGGYSLAKHSVTAAGLALIGASVLLFVTEAAWDTRFIAGLAGTVALCVGSTMLLAGRPRISTTVGCTMSVLFGAVTTVLAAAARRARRNKRIDLEK
ncbi:MAG: hypothetical protein JO061_12490 [Acidobacteriaceae bacterium]|nr:hypothetical protein [Acidobacteriaceae bacterium]